MTQWVEVQSNGGGGESNSSQTIGLDVNIDAHSKLSFLQHGARRKAVLCWRGGELHLALQGRVSVFAEVSAYPQSANSSDPRRASAPVAGKVTQLAVAVGDAVAEGQPLACIEAMKMEMWISAAMAGRVKAVHSKVGDQIELGALLVELEPA
jgi:geranyl-CoA carboxylase alpha subunit